MGTSIKIIAIKTSVGVYISDNTNGKDPYYYSSGLGSYFFDGQKPESTYAKDWFKINSVPEKIEKAIPDKRVNVRWELKAGYPESPLTPKLITDNPNYEESEFYAVSGLYEQKFETEPGGYEVVEFEISIIAEDENFQIVKQQFPVENAILDRITFNPILLPSRPCKISSEQLYVIVRKHIKQNINPKYAQITSDYDFCIEVQKVLEITDRVPVQSTYGTGKRKRTVTSYRDKKTIKVFSCAPKVYNSYPVIEPIIGDNYSDLEKKVDDYLKEIMESINKPVKECPTCKGAGAIIEK